MNDNPLFQPFKSNNLELTNRVLMAPMTRNFSPGGIPPEAAREYYAARARGGVGLIITEGTTINHPSANGYPDVPHFYGENALAAWKKIAEAVHQEGGKIFPQIWHVGSVREKGMESDPDVPGYSASAMRHPIKKEGDVAHAMTESDIADIILAYAKAARSAKATGFDGVEIHGAHGYLIDQFFWEKTNHRTDSYGGELAARTRFACEIIAAIRQAVGPDFPVMLRYSQWKMGDYSAKLAASARELESFLDPLVQAGVDLFHCSTRRFYQAEFENSALNLAGWTQKITGKPCVSVGSVGLKGEFLRAFLGKSAKAEPVDELLERMHNQEFDLVAVGRALISEPDWVNKIHEGRENEIRGFDAEDLKELK